MLSLEKVQAAGKQALRGLFKYRTQPKRPGLSYVGIIWIPFDQYCFQINVESIEVGTTGRREAAVMLIEGNHCQTSNEPPIYVASVEELFERLGSACVNEVPSDHEQYDRLFPDHPLTKVRLRLRNVLDTLRFDDSLEQR